MSVHAASVHLDSAAPRGPANEPIARAVRAQIELMMSRPEFDASARNRRFLSFVVEETLAGRAARIKAYTIALAVFDRGQDFDPLTDPIVRIEASRLRRAIEHYYLTSGKSDPVRVDMPKGSYVPTFSYLTPNLPVEDVKADAAARIPADSAADAAAQRRRQFVLGMAMAMLLALTTAAYLVGLRQDTPARQKAFAPKNLSILVLPFQSANADRRYENVANGLSYEIISQLTSFEEFFVFGPVSEMAGSGNTAAPLARTPDYVLAGTVLTSDAAIRVSVVLTEQATGRSLWAWSREEALSTADILGITRSISQRVVNMLAQPDGVILEKLQRKVASTPALDLSSYECIISFRTYWRSYSRDNFDDTLACLERTIAAEPAYGPAYSALALVYVDKYRFGFGGGDPQGTALEQAAKLARKAEELEPRSSQPYLALSLALWFQHRVEESIATAERGLTFNPNNAELMADLGLRHAQLGHWDRALALVNDAYERDPSAPSGYRVVLFLHAYMAGDYRNALTQAEQMGAVATIYSHVARAAALGQLGELSRGTSAVADILRIDPQYGSKVRTDLAKRNMAPHIIDAIVEGLRKAGLAV